MTDNELAFILRKGAFCVDLQASEEIQMASSKKKGPVEKIALQCTECKRKNYTTEKNRRNTPNKLELMKYCPFEHKHTLFGVRAGQ